MVYCRNGVLVFDVFEVGLVSKSEFFDPFVRSWCFLGGFCWILIGRQARAIKRVREIDESDDKGPLLKAKSKSLKFASQAKKNPKVPVKCTEVKVRGMKRLRKMIGRRQISLFVPGETNLRIK